MQTEEAASLRRALHSKWSILKSLPLDHLADEAPSIAVRPMPALASAAPASNQQLWCSVAGCFALAALLLPLALPISAALFVVALAAFVWMGTAFAFNALRSESDEDDRQRECGSCGCGSGCAAAAGGGASGEAGGCSGGCG